MEVVEDAPNDAPMAQDRWEEQCRYEQPERKVDGPRGSAEVQVSLGWTQDEVGDLREEDMMQARGPDEDVLHQEPPSWVAHR